MRQPMTIKVPLLLRFARPFGRVAESDEPEMSGASATERNAVAAESLLIGRGESRFTRVRNETTDDE